MVGYSRFSALVRVMAQAGGGRRVSGAGEMGSSKKITSQGNRIAVGRLLVGYL